MNHKYHLFYSVYTDENPLDVIDEQLSCLHKSEVGSPDKTISYEIYDNLSCVVFYENGIQLAYYVFAVLRHHHYDKLVFQDVSYFVKKEFRLKYAREIFKTVEEVAKELNCDLMITHCKTKSQMNFFKKMDFDLKDYLLVKEI